LRSGCLFNAPDQLPAELEALAKFSLIDKRRIHPVSIGIYPNSQIAAVMEHIQCPPANSLRLFSGGHVNLVDRPEGKGIFDHRWVAASSSQICCGEIIMFRCVEEPDLVQTKPDRRLQPWRNKPAHWLAIADELETP
jgi:hypothetical protein